jgi:hypothetical protein
MRCGKMMLVDNLDRPAAAYISTSYKCALRLGGYDADHVGVGCCKSLTNVSISLDLVQLARVAADKHPVEKTSALHRPHWLINQFWPSA